MRRLDFGLGLVALAAVVAAVTVVVISSRDSTPQATAQDTTSTLTAAVSPEGCARVTAQLTSDTSTPEPATEWTFSTNAYVKLTATAVDGCTFTRWELTFGGKPFFNSSQNPFQFQLIGDMVVTVRFTGTPVIPTPTPTPTPTP
ncbi:MAG: hypothetical protein F4Y54_01320, partial [Dehalococcoidia bacterium]|nr:hypothetical protein [Dehalococcoidia bacterium]